MSSLDDFAKDKLAARRASGGKPDVRRTRCDPR
jgi:hypothetical protein